MLQQLMNKSKATGRNADRAVEGMPGRIANYECDPPSPKTTEC